MINKGKKIFRNNNRNSVRVAVLLFFLIHLVFYVTGFLPDKSQYTCSEFRIPQRLSDYKTVTLIRWDYSPKDRVMELVFDLKNTAYSEGVINFTAVYDNVKNLDSQVVYNADDMLVIQLYKIPDNTGKKINITFEYTPAGEKMYETSFYSFTGIINEVAALPVLSTEEYYLGRLDYDIAYYQVLIRDLETSVAKNEASLAAIEADMQRLQSNDTQLTTDELLNLNTTLENERGTIKALRSKNEEYRLQISSHQENLDILVQRKAEYEQDNR